MLPLKGKITTVTDCHPSYRGTCTPGDNGNKTVCECKLNHKSTFNWCNKNTETHTYFQPFLEVGVASGAVLTLTSLK